MVLVGWRVLREFFIFLFYGETVKYSILIYVWVGKVGFFFRSGKEVEFF